MNHEEVMTNYLFSFIDGLIQGGVRHAVISPGSRSTPLAMLLAERSQIETHVIVDERSAAFFALGIAKMSQAPVALLCTSGTAAANYYPAIIEAKYARVPLIVLTADRPHELREIGAPQAIDQLSLYGKHVKWHVDLALPEGSETMKRYAQATAVRAVTESVQSPKGPVHINVPLREPLIPHLEQQVDKLIPPMKIHTGMLSMSVAQADELASMLEQKQKGLIICGPLDDPSCAESIVRFGKKVGFPILADPLSQLRSQSSMHEEIIDCYDTFLRNEEVKKTYQPDIVIRFGAMPVSKALLLYLQEQKDAYHLVVDGGAGYRNPNFLMTEMIYCEERIFCETMTERVKIHPNFEWLNQWIQLNALTKGKLQSFSTEELNEGELVLRMSRLLPEESLLFVGNSMPIRDVDTFFHQVPKNIRILANRGANGIDGVVSSALGASLYAKQAYLLIGDLSFFHDLTGLFIAKAYHLPLTVVLVNNNGGGIFSFLPQAKYPKHFEQLFGTPLHLSFEYLAHLYEGEYHLIHDWNHFEQELSKTNQQGLRILEVQTNRESNAAIHRQLWANVSEILSLFVKDEHL
jgi:2-succinyl-5-enolpyruvyl-6-hydroxy-3-cyclohexene-1-carboxylate synthase